MSPKACQVSPDNDCPFQETLGRIEKKLDDVSNRLFVDNGKLSIQSEIINLKSDVKEADRRLDEIVVQKEKKSTNSVAFWIAIAAAVIGAIPNLSLIHI